MSRQSVGSEESSEPSYAVQREAGRLRGAWWPRRSGPITLVDLGGDRGRDGCADAHFAPVLTGESGGETSDVRDRLVEVADRPASAGLDAGVAWNRFAGLVAASLGVDGLSAVYLASDRIAISRLGHDEGESLMSTSPDAIEVPRSSEGSLEEQLVGALTMLGHVGVDSIPSGSPEAALRVLRDYTRVVETALGPGNSGVVLWSGPLAGMLGPTLSQGIGHPACAVTRFSGWEMPIGALAESRLPTEASLVTRPDADAAQASAALPPRVAWQDTGFIQTPVVAWPSAGSGPWVEGPFRVTADGAADVVVPPETIATLVDGLLVCGPETWSTR